MDILITQEYVINVIPLVNPVQLQLQIAQLVVLIGYQLQHVAVILASMIIKAPAFLVPLNVNHAKILQLIA